MRYLFEWMTFWASGVLLVNGVMEGEWFFIVPAVVSFVALITRSIWEETWA